MSVWWIDEPSVLGSSNPTDDELKELHGQGFNILVSLLDEDEQLPMYNPEAAQALGFVRHAIPIRDYHAPSIAQCWDFTKLMKSLPHDSKVLIHCQGGTGRTGTMAAIYWVANKLTPDQALLLVRSRRHGAAEEAPEQEAIVHEFAIQYR